MSNKGPKILISKEEVEEMDILVNLIQKMDIAHKKDLLAFFQGVKFGINMTAQRGA